MSPANPVPSLDGGGQDAVPGAAAGSTHVEFKEVSKSYDGGDSVVDGLNLSIRKGEFVTLLGPSGSGKTTILMMLAGFQTPTSGTIRINGRSVQDRPPRKRGIGMVFQSYALFPHMTVGGNLAFPLEVRGIEPEERRERVRYALRLISLEGMEDRRPGQLSGGQQQRVAIARALVFQPDLVLMDEPLGALDRILREEMQYEIRGIHQRLGVTVVYVTHDQQEAMVMSDRIAVLNGGLIEQAASPEVLYEEPERTFVARFVGENNRLHGRVAALHGHFCDVETGGERVRALRIVRSGIGEKVTLSIRPERIAINPRSGLYGNQVDAIVEDMSFHGDHLRVRLAACGRRDFIAKIPNTVGHGAILVGDKVRIGWTVTDCRALNYEKQLKEKGNS